jgi:hypothetical protein
MLYIEKDVNDFASNLAAVSNAVSNSRQNRMMENKQQLEFAQTSQNEGNINDALKKGYGYSRDDASRILQEQGRTNQMANEVKAKTVESLTKENAKIIPTPEYIPGTLKANINNIPEETSSSGIAIQREMAANPNYFSGVKGATLDRVAGTPFDDSIAAKALPKENITSLVKEIKQSTSSLKPKEQSTVEKEILEILNTSQSYPEFQERASSMNKFWGLRDQDYSHYWMANQKKTGTGYKSEERFVQNGDSTITLTTAVGADKNTNAELLARQQGFNPGQLYIFAGRDNPGTAGGAYIQLPVNKQGVGGSIQEFVSAAKRGLLTDDQKAKGLALIDLYGRDGAIDGVSMGHKMFENSSKAKSDLEAQIAKDEGDSQVRTKRLALKQDQFLAKREVFKDKNKADEFINALANQYNISSGSTASK